MSQPYEKRPGLWVYPDAAPKPGTKLTPERIRGHYESLNRRRGEPEIHAFTEQILENLNLEKNVSKGSWQMTPLHVFRKAREVERKESVEAVDRYYHSSDTQSQIAALREIEREAADEGAYSMMLHAEARRVREELEDMEREEAE